MKSLNRKYYLSKTQAEPLYFSKLAIIELCGWIETSMDEIFEACAPKFIDAPSYSSKFSQNIDSTYGFSEKRHLKPLIQALVGFNGLEKLETACDPSILGNLNRNLNELTKMRNELAHTYIKGFTITIDSPLLVLHRFEQVADGLDHLEDRLCRLADDLRCVGP